MVACPELIGERGAKWFGVGRPLPGQQDEFSPDFSPGGASQEGGCARGVVAGLFCRGMVMEPTVLGQRVRRAQGGVRRR